MDLESYFREKRRIAIAFSGGVDSAYLLYAAKHFGAEATAYYLKTPFQPQFELDDARRLAAQLEVPLCVLEWDVLSDEKVRANGERRCYYCKKQMFTQLIQRAARDGYTVIADGTNASDDRNDRPGMRALQELKVCSPLRECGLTKKDIRKLSREAGLFTWDKPAYACLATRIPFGEQITKETLYRIEQAEQWLSSQGYVDFRVRVSNNNAKLQLKKEQFLKYFAEEAVVRKQLMKWFDTVSFDLNGRK